MAANVLVCSFHESGHWRYGYHCNKSHTQDTCTSFPCMKEDCHKRHPKLCKYFILSGFCKFHEKCSYLHITRNLDLKSQLETEVENLKQEIQSLFNHVSELRGIVNSLSTSSTASSIVQSSLNPVASQSTTSSALITTAVSTPVLFPNSSSQSEDSIPQLDGGFSLLALMLLISAKLVRKSLWMRMNSEYMTVSSSAVMNVSSAFQCKWLLISTNWKSTLDVCQQQA